MFNIFDIHCHLYIYICIWHMYIFPYIYIYSPIFLRFHILFHAMFVPTGWKPSERFRHFFYMFLGVGWGGVITFTYLRTPMMLRHGTFTCTCTHTSCYVEDVSRHAGVGWGGVITFTYLRTIDSCWRMIKASVPDQLTSCPENEQKLNDLIWTYVRTCQWRWEANVVGKTLLEKTGAYLAKM